MKTIFEFILLLVISGFFIFLGWRIWKKQQITLIHDYHYKNVKKEDIKPYTAKMGKALMIMGAGIGLTGIFDVITGSAYGWVFFLIFFITGLVQIFIAQIRYNGGLF
jgi:hypothetical protein